MKKILPILFWLICGSAWAANPTCPTRALDDTTNACASTTFVQNQITGGSGIPSFGLTGYVYCNGAGVACSAATTIPYTVVTSGYPVANLGGLGTGVATALAINTETAGAFVVNGGGLGTPTSGVGTNITSVNAATLGGATFASPGSIGSGTPASGAFTTLSASSTVSGTGFSTYLASPPAIGGSSAAAGSFTTLTGTSYRFTNLISSSTAPTFTSGACTGSIGTTNGTAAFTFTTGSGSCGSTATIGLPSAATGWNCFAYDLADGAGSRISATTSSQTSVVFTHYSIGSTPGTSNFATTHTVQVSCTAY